MSIIFAFNLGGLEQALQTTLALDYLAKFYGFVGGYVLGGVSTWFVKKRYKEYKRLRDVYEKRFETTTPELYLFWEKYNRGS